MRRVAPWFSMILPFLFLCTLFVLLFANGSVAAEGVRRGITLCTETLFPSLFPFLVLSELLIGVGAGRVLGGLLSKPLRPLLGLSGAGCSAFLLGVLCGVPVGTGTAVSLFEQGEISKAELQRLQLFGNQASFGFMVGAVGQGMFGSTRIGLLLYGILLLSALVLGILLRIGLGKVEEIPKKPPDGIKKGSSLLLLTACIKRAFFSLLQVCSYVIFFSCLASCTVSVAQRLTLPTVLAVCLNGLLEMTSGIHLAATRCSPDLAFRLAAFFAAFSGLSICMQLFSLTEKHALSLAQYLLAKLAQGGVALFFSSVYIILFAGSLSEKPAVDVIAMHSPTPIPLLILTAAVLVLLFKKKRRPRGAPKTKRGRI